jgi:hypothetical protein
MNLYFEKVQSKTKITKSNDTYNAVGWNVWSLHGESNTVQYYEDEHQIVKPLPREESATGLMQPS